MICIKIWNLCNCNWNPARCSCENGNYLESVIDNSVNTSDKNITTKSTSTKGTSIQTFPLKTFPKNKKTK